MISILEASKRTKVSKSTLIRAIKSGKLSGRKNDNGGFEVDPAELHRVYPDAALPQQEKQQDTANDATDALVRQMQQMIDLLKEDRDAWRDQAQRLALSKPDETKPSSLFSRLFKAA